jgi:predicted ATPase
LFPLGALATLRRLMRIEGVRLRNFRAFRDVDLRDLPSFAVFVDATGTGKTTLFSVFQFLHEALTTNVTSAFGKLGGFQDVCSRGSSGPIEIELRLRHDAEHDEPALVRYALHLEEQHGRPVVAHEQLEVCAGDKPRSYPAFGFYRGLDASVKIAVGGSGEAPTSMRPDVDTRRLKRPERPEMDEWLLRSADILALKGISQFAHFRWAAALGTLVETWHLSARGPGRARTEQELGDARHLTSSGDNLPLVLEHLQRHHPDVLAQIVQRLARRVPGLQHVETKVTEEGRVLLKFQDGAFAAPFLAHQVSDGTIKMLAYLVLLLDPDPRSLLCVEEPEHHLYPTLLSELAEELRAYAVRGRQVLVTSRSPDFLNAVELHEVFWLVKRKGVTEVRRGRDNAQLKAYIEEGDKLGDLWKQGLFDDDRHDRRRDHTASDRARTLRARPSPSSRDRQA